MRMAELSQRSGVPVATIKFYRREGLLAPGAATAPNQAVYGDAHLDRLRLIRVLREVADLPVAALRDVVAAIEDRDRSLHEVVGTAHAALDPAAHADVSPTARARADRVIADAGWQVSDRAPARASLARALEAVEELGLSTDPEVMARYVAAADAVAAAEVESALGADASDSRDAVVARVVAGTVLFEHVLVALRRLAQEHHSSRRGSQDEPA